MSQPTQAYLKICLLGILFPSFKFKECFKKVFVTLTPRRCLVFWVLPLLHSEQDGLLRYTTGLLLFLILIQRLLSQSVFPHGDLGLESWLCLRPFTQPRSPGENCLGKPLAEAPICFLFKEKNFICWRTQILFSLLCCNPHATEKSSLQRGINPLLCPIQTQGLPLCRSFQIPKAFLVSGSAGCTKGQCTNRIQHWERTGL